MPKTCKPTSALSFWSAPSLATPPRVVQGHAMSFINSEQEMRSEDQESISEQEKNLKMMIKKKKPTQTDKEVVQGEGADAEMNDAQQGNENLKTTQEQVEDAHVTISTITKKTESFDSIRIKHWKKNAAELKKDPLHPHVTTLVDEHLDTRLGETREEFMKFLSESLTTRIKEQVKYQLPKILPKEVLTCSPGSKSYLKNHVEITHSKVSSQPHSTYEAASTLTEFELKKILIDKMEKRESYLAAPEHRDCYYKIPVRPSIQTYSKGTHSNYAELEYDFEECYKDLSEKLDWENPEGGDYPFDLSKPLPLITRGKRQRVPFKYFINNDLKIMAVQYDLPSIKDMVPNIWSPVKVAYDKYALWGISHWREQPTHVKKDRGNMDTVLAKRRWSTLEKKRSSSFHDQYINKAAKGKEMDEFGEIVGGRLNELTSDCCKEQT
ncbi:hypothetical protein Tco_0491811 [Tanacetum coccineum]